MGMRTFSFRCEQCPCYAKMTVFSDGPHDPQAFANARMLAMSDGWEIFDHVAHCPAHRAGAMSGA